LVIVGELEDGVEMGGDAFRFALGSSSVDKDEFDEIGLGVSVVVVAEDPGTLLSSGI